MQPIKTYLLASCLTLTMAIPAFAEDMAAMTPEEMQQEHGGQTFHMFRLETDTGINRGNSISNWDLDGWIGTDENKLWIKSEGEHKDGKLEEAEKFYKRALLILQEAVNPFDGSLIALMESYAGLLRKSGRDDEADHLKACALGRVSGNMRTVTGTHLPEV